LCDAQKRSPTRHRRKFFLRSIAPFATLRTHAQSLDEYIIEKNFMHASRTIACFRASTKNFFTRIPTRVSIDARSHASPADELMQIFFRKHVDTPMTRD